MAALSKAAQSPSTKVDILWAFHADSIEKAVEESPYVFKTCEPILTTHRFRAYTGIEIHTFFQVLADRKSNSNAHAGTPTSRQLSEGTKLPASTKLPARPHPGATRPFASENSAQPNAASTSAARPTPEHTDPIILDLWKSALSDETGYLVRSASALISAVATDSPTLANSQLTACQRLLYEPYGSAEPLDSRPFHTRRHVIIAAPTSSGKSTVADMFLLVPTLHNRRRPLSIYIAPTRALAQAKHHDLLHLLSSVPEIQTGVILSTGEDNDHDWQLSHAAFTIACMVYEKASVLFSRNQTLLDKLSCLLIDEAFMLGDLSRGPGLEIALAKALHHRHDHDSRADRAGDESLRIVALTTEGAPPPALRELLTAYDSEQDSDIAPLIYSDGERPVSIEHCLLLSRGASRQNAHNVFPFVTFSGTASRTLTDEHLHAVDAQLHPLAQELADVRGNLTISPPIEHRERIVRFVLSRLADEPSNYRMLVFAPGKVEVEDLAGAIANKRKTPEQLPDQAERLKSLLTHLAESEDRAIAKRMKAYAEKGVYFHHADIERRIRREVERLAGTRTMYSFPSEVLVSTTTLAYGVNLVVSEVLLVGVTFYTQNRRGARVKQDLSNADFHNMTGRAGRLGKTTATPPRAYISLPLDVAQPLGVIKQYYRKPEPLKSKLFVADDRRSPTSASSFGSLKANLLAAVPDYEPSPITILKSFTQPFVQAVLESLRHLNYLRTGGSSATAPVPLAEDPQGVDLFTFLSHTLYAHQYRSDGSRIRDFGKSIANVLRGCCEPPLQLVSRPSRPVQEPAYDQELYEITEIGEAVIDTITEIGTVDTLARAAGQIRSAWDETFPGQGFPIELYILALLLQAEVYDVVIKNTPEGRGGGKRRNWTTQVVETNRATVAEIFKLSLREISGSEVYATEYGERLRSELEDFDTVRLISTPYAGGGVDALCRLFASVTAWIDGRSITASRRFAEKLRPDAEGPNHRLDGQRMNFRQLTEKLRYKAVFLAKLLSAGTSEIHASIEEVRQLFTLAERLRLGAKVDAIPLFYPNASSLSRAEAHNLVAEGWTAQRILLQSSRETVLEPLSEDKSTQLQADLEDLCVTQFNELSREMTLGPASSIREQIAEAFWHSLSGITGPAAFATSVHSYRHGGRVDRPFARVFLEHFDFSRSLPLYWFSGNPTRCLLLLRTRQQGCAAV